MIINVPFIYEALIKVKSTSKPTMIAVRDSIDVEVRSCSADQLKPAILMGNNVLLWDGQSLFKECIEFKYGKTTKYISSEEVLEHIDRVNVMAPYAQENDYTPFAYYWDSEISGVHGMERVTAIRNAVRDNSAAIKSKVPCDTWLLDFRGSAIEQINRIANSIVFFDNKLCRKVEEPRLLLTIENIGTDNVRVGFRTVQPSHQLRENEYLFGLKQKGEASSFCTRLVSGYGVAPTHPISIDHIPEFTVHIPDSTTYLNPLCGIDI